MGDMMAVLTSQSCNCMRLGRAKDLRKGEEEKREYVDFVEHAMELFCVELQNLSRS